MIRFFAFFFSKFAAKFIYIYIILLVAESKGQPELYEDTLEDSHGKVIYSSVVIRHGDRSPISFALEDEDPRAFSTWPEGLSQLTKIGKEEIYELGKWFAARYADKIKNGYKHDLITINSTNTDRTIMSALALAAGMFPPKEEEMWADDGLKWQPVPTSEIKYKVLRTIDVCDRYEMEELLLSQTAEFQELNSSYAEVMEYIANHSDYRTTNPMNVIENFRRCWDCYNQINIEELANLTLPSWTAKVYPQPLKRISEIYFGLVGYTVEMQRIKTGVVMTQIVQEMQEKRSGQRSQAFHMYMTHETYIAIFLHALNVYNNLIPPSASATMIELRVKNEEYIVTMMYRNSTTHSPYLLPIPGCGDVCSLDKFAELTAHLTVKDENAECQVGFLERLYYFTSIFTIIGCILIIILLACTCSICTKAVKKRRYDLSYLAIPDPVMFIRRSN